MHRSLCWYSFNVLMAIGGGLLGQPGSTGPLTDTDRTQVEVERKLLEKRLAKIAKNDSLKPDVLIFLKSIEWALRYDAKLDAKDAAQIKEALQRARQRMDALEADKTTWPGRHGKLVRGFVSGVDGSVQPYGLIVPAKYDSTKPIRLDVVLHGSTRPVGMAALRFLKRFDEGDDQAKNAPDQEFIELHPLGRVENGYRWAGETDVLEAIDAVQRQYKIDPDRIVLRGMSMGASGTWHLGLKHLDRFVALGPYCGYVDTHQFSLTPLANFVKVGPLPANQEKTLHLLDSMDYAANAGIMPAIACMGDKDVFFQAHVIMGQAMEKEGLKMVNLISPGTGHVIDPVTFKEQMRRIKEYADKGLDHNPKQVRFVTWSLKYGRCRWVQLLGLEEHYRRAEFVADIAEDGGIDVKKAANVTRFAITAPAWKKPRISIEGSDVALPASANTAPDAVFGRKAGQWTYLGSLAKEAAVGKRPGVQGPIDDAFTTPFLCVRGTGQAWNPKIQSWADESLKRFGYEWHRYFRGELRIKHDTGVTDDDVRSCNLILFGDPGSNAWIKKVLPRMPLEWSRTELKLGQDRYAAADHAPVLIQPNPLAANRYVVFNSGHTFGEKELATLNYLLFPHLGDWAVMRIGDKAGTQELIKTGFCDEQWQVP